MKQSSNGKGRMRGRNPVAQKRGPSRNQVYDSNGPGGRVRGNAHQVVEKYQALARDAAAQGDRVLCENCLQYAEHYLRIILQFNHNNPQRAVKLDQNQALDDPHDFDQDGMGAVVEPVGVAIAARPPAPGAIADKAMEETLAARQAPHRGKIDEASEEGVGEGVQSIAQGGDPAAAKRPVRRRRAAKAGEDAPAASGANT